MLNKNVSILLIDDNDITREVLRVVLRSEGYNVVGEATDGGTGLDMALKLRPHIILLDVVMPKVSGLEILPKLKDMLPESRVLMVTASHDQETISEAVKAGIHGLILKPFNAQKIIDTVAGVVSKLEN
ncbi:MULTISPECIES: response regulator transcription factor [unclassified Undibacterium]|uniref:response regulator n=1 Tax=unclassified Undibacterium TaxID=2630295 RepID=UPI002AC9AA27|nr:MULTISPECIES: response regulator transcription factor [unclassified Undibacterium]MEB0137919.1 response regulator transcription factor [Undibacterium sp. CCC2.1]MEB0172039.1 response regulator transcription factor [Undibacterium sp. CCC1.1]MEB0174927.1 response regulator transcription factor [Undibacterium sp. CCC3.4]MEB0214865.1 response regulator transcription factor [Undibacterium sp. 5I2]WPX45372.1 response regulator transcription factor [Undibacterium sp. CCC3.4]